MVHCVCINESYVRGNINICKALRDGFPYYKHCVKPDLLLLVVIKLLPCVRFFVGMNAPVGVEREEISHAVSREMFAPKFGSNLK